MSKQIGLAIEGTATKKRQEEKVEFCMISLSLYLQHLNNYNKVKNLANVNLHIKCIYF